MRLVIRVPGMRRTLSRSTDGHGHFLQNRHHTALAAGFTRIWSAIYIMILEILPNTLQRMTQFYAVPGQFLARTDPG